MIKLSTARESLFRLEARIAAQTDPKRRSWLRVYRDHWWNEVIGDVNAVMATMSRGPISYRFDGHPFVTPDSSLASVQSYEDTRRMYDGVVATGVNMAGSVDDERIAFDEYGLLISSVLTSIYPGLYLTRHSDPVDPSEFYMVRWWNLTTIRFDSDELMMGEGILNGAPMLVKQVHPSQVNCLIDGPLPVF